MLVLAIITVIIYTHILNLLLLLIVLGVIVYWTIKKIGYAVEVVKLTEKTMHLIMKNIRIRSSVDDDNWDVDCMKHPDNYDEHHVQYVPYDLIVSQHEENTIHTINCNARLAEINNFETGLL